MDYLFGIILTAVLFASVCQSTDILVGQTGLLSTMAAAFMSIGAYATGIATARLGLPSVYGMILGACLCGTLGSVAALGYSKTERDMFLVATFALQLALTGVSFNLSAVTNGAEGITGIAPIAIQSPAISKFVLFMAAISLLFVSSIIYRNIVRSPLGRVLHAIREDELLAQTLGKNVPFSKLYVLSSSACVCGAAGSLYANYLGYIDPTCFTLNESVMILSMIIIGGAGSSWGPVVGAAILICFPEALRTVGVSGPAAASIRQILYGTGLIACVVFFPRGIAGVSRKFNLRALSTPPNS